MNFRYSDKFKKTALFVIIIISVLAGIFFSYWLVFFLMPFFIAFVLSSLMEPLIKLMEAKMRIRRKIAAPIVLLLLLAAIVSLLVLAVIRLVNELKALIVTAPGFFQNLYLQITDWTDRSSHLFDWLPVGAATDNVASIIANISTTITNLGTSIARGAFTTAVSFPEVLIFTLITIMATYFMSSDREKISGIFVRHLPESWVRSVLTIKNDMFNALFGYLRSALIIMAITFTELFIGLSIIGIRYALLAAFLIAIIDALPVLGTGSILIPWAVYSFITGDIRMGISILVLYVVVLVVRQIVEPKILGHQIGVYPLMTLAAMYAGLRTIGFAGLILGPITFLLIRNILIAIYKNRTFKDIIGFNTESGKEEP